MAEGIGFTNDLFSSLRPGSLGTLRSWHKADSLSLNDGDSVTTWEDSGANNHDLAQATAANKPTLKKTAANGRPALLFDGTNDYLTTSFSTASQPITVFIVRKRISGATGATDQYLLDGISASHRLAIAYVNATGLSSIAGSAVLSSIASLGNDWDVLQATFNTTTSSFFVNDILHATGTVGTGDLTGYTIGASYVPNSYFNGYVAEILVFDGAVTAANAWTIRRYLQAKYKVNYFDPTSISGLLEWYAADRIGGLRDGDAVSEWPSYGASGISLIQATGANQPLFKINQQNFKPAIRFDGSNDILAGATAFSLGANDACTIFVVGKVSTKTNFGHFLSYGTTGAGSFNYRQVSNSGKGSLVSGADGLGAGATTVATTPTGSAADLQGQGFKVHSALITTANQWTTWENAAQMDTVSKSFTLAASATLTAGSRSDGFPLNGDIAEIMLFNVALTTANRQRIEGYLRAKYAL